MSMAQPNGKVLLLEQQQNDRIGRLEDYQQATVKEVARHTEQLVNIEGKVDDLKGSMDKVSDIVNESSKNLAIISSREESRRDIKGWVIALAAGVIGSVVEVAVHFWIK